MMTFRWNVLQLLITCGYILTNEADVDYLTNIIKKYERRARVHQLPTDAKEHMYTSPTINGYGIFDFIIVGAGAAGGILANRLSEVEDWSILLIEAGTFENNFTDIPAMSHVTMYSRYNWGYTTVPQKTSCLGLIDQKCPVNRGKGIGGTTIINALFYNRGNCLDYDKWGEDNPGWSYEDVLPYYIKSEDSHIFGDPGYHGTGGPVNVEYYSNFGPQYYAFFDANIELEKQVVDYNGKDQLGVATSQINTENGRRESTGRAFVDPARSRCNLHIATKSYATKILIEKKTKKAFGVQFTKDGMIFEAKARNEVIVSAGAIATPQLLMLSGIGPAKHLSDHNIPVIKHLPGVGENLLDHPVYRGLNVETDYEASEKDLETKVKEYLSGYGPLTEAGNAPAVVFCKSRRTEENPDIEIILQVSPNTDEFFYKVGRYTKSVIQDTWGSSDPNCSLTLLVILLTTESRGTVKLKSNDPFDYPLIDLKLFSDPANIDIEKLYIGITFGLERLNTTAFSKIGAKLAAKPLQACKKYKYLSKEYWYCAIRQMGTSLCHPTGTCRMGSEPKNGDVVDNKLKVHGIENLRIIDASVFPFSFTAHTGTITMMLAEKASDMIKQEYKVL